MCLPSDDDDIPPLPIPIKMECDLGVLLHMRQAFGIFQTIDEDRRGAFVPQKPDRRRLWHTLGVNRGEPDYAFITQPTSHTLTKWCRWVWKLKWHSVFPILCEI